MHWAPVQHVAPQICKERGELRIRNVSKVEWYKNGRLHKTFSLNVPVKGAVFAWFRRHHTPNELWVCIILSDQSVHSFATSTGESKITGLNFQPNDILSCGKLGLVLTSVTDSGLEIWLLQRPEELLQAVVPSPMASEFTSSDKLVYMNEYVAVIWNENETTVRALGVKILNYSSRLGYVSDHTSSGVYGNEFKAAILTPLIEWNQISIEQIFTQELSEQQAWLLATHDPETHTLYVYSQETVVRYDRIKRVVPLAGLKQIPAVACLGDEQLQLKYLFFPDIEPLGISTGLGGLLSDNIASIRSESDENWMHISFTSGKTQRVQLYDQLTPDLDQCFGLIGHNLGAMSLVAWLTEWLVQRRSSTDDWSAFRETFVKCIGALPEQTSVQLIFHLHMLREEFRLFETKENSCNNLASLIKPFVKSWGGKWQHLYATEAPECIFQHGINLKCDFDPPSVISSLIHKLDHTYGEPIPDLTQMETFFPTTCAFQRLFGLAKFADNDQTIEELRKELKTSKTVEILPSLNYCLQACFLQLMQLVSLSDDFQQPRKPSRQDMFPGNRCSDEALNLLQTQRPQHVVYGPFIDRLAAITDESLGTHSDWSSSIKLRTLASAFGQAALNLESLNPLMWEQLSIPQIDFSGECTETGLTIGSNQDGLTDNDLQNAWGIFSHGTALALSISRDAKVDSAWVTSLSRLKHENKIFYAGFVYGIGLMGFLKNLEDWHFYESLVGSDQYGALAALIGVAASKMGTRDAKLTKVLSVHIRALLPHGFSGVHFVGAQVEQGSLIALGLLNLGSGADQLSEKLRRSLIRQAPAETATDGTFEEHSEAYKYSLGLSLGLINFGTGRIDHLNSLLSFVSPCCDQLVSSSESVNGIILALILAFTGTKNSKVASFLAFPEGKMALKYFLPTSFFGRALAHDLILWDATTDSREGFESTRNQLKNVLDKPVTGCQDVLCEYYWVAGRLVALAMRFVSTNDKPLISHLTESITLLLHRYKQLLKLMYESEAHDKSQPGEKHVHFNYGLVHHTRTLADIIAHLSLAASAVAAGFGSLAVMRLLRELWQVDPQFLCNSLGPKSAKYNRIAECGLDLTMIAQSIGWLFMGDGQVTFKPDAQSVSLLAVFSFQKLLAGPNIQHEHWQHLRFLWSTLTENRCLFAAHDPSDPVSIKINLKNNQCNSVNLKDKMPMLLPPFDKIVSIEIVDPRYANTVITDLSEARLSNGIKLDKVIANPQSLQAKLLELGENAIPTNTQTSRWQGEDINHLRAVLEQLTQSQLYQTQFLLMLAFFRCLPSPSKCIFSAQWLEQLRLKRWLVSNINEQEDVL